MSHFQDFFRKWIESACLEWDCPFPGDQYFANVFSRLSLGVMEVLAHGVRTGIVIEKGKQFSLTGLAKHKGPYNWFSKTRGKHPSPNWEYYVQVAEYVRLYESTKSDAGLTVTFEDDLMDLAVYEGSELRVCCEVKEKSSQLMRLITGIRKYEGNVDYTLADRGNDPLRKAKYIVNRRPRYFYLVSIGRKLEFSVTYPQGKAFELHESVVPLV